MPKFYKSPTIVIGLILFLALVIGTVYRVMTAFNTNPELVNENAYKVGEDYGKNIAISNELRKQGYLIKLEVDNYINYNKNHRYNAYFTKNDVILDGANITANFYRQLEPEFDFKKTFEKNQLNTTLPRKGKWLLVIKAEFEDKILYKYHKIYAY